MDRRAFLGAAGVGTTLLTGCSQLNRDSSVGTSLGGDRSNSSGPTTNPESGYAREYEPVDPEGWDLGVLYADDVIGDWDCVDGRPTTGVYESLAPDVVNHQIDVLQGFGVGRLVFRVDSAGDFESLAELAVADLADSVDLEIHYDLQRPILEGRNLTHEMSAVRDRFSQGNYATYRDRPVVTLGTVDEFVEDDDEAASLHSAIASEHGDVVGLLETVRSRLTVDGTEPFLVAELGPLDDLSVARGIRSRHGEAFAAVDGVTNRYRPPDRARLPWREDFTVQKRVFSTLRAFTDWLDLEFLPTVYPGLDRRVDQCADDDRAIPRSPSNLAEFLEYAGQYSLSGRIQIDSFNDWLAGTQVEPGTHRGESYGASYLEAAHGVLTESQPRSQETRSELVVSTSGSDTNVGTADAPIRTITEALSRAGPGTTVRVRPGVYQEGLQPPRGGEPGAPITVTGPQDAVLLSDPEQFYMLYVRHSHVHLTGLTIQGLHDPDNPDDPESYTPAMIDVRPVRTTDEFVEDVVIAPHAIGNSQGGLVSLDRTRHAEVGPFRLIGPVGVRHLLTGEPDHTGEIVYVGTAPGNLGSEWHPWTEYDGTSDIHVHHIDNSAGYAHSEIVNTKLGTHDVLVEYCTDGGGSQNTETYESAAVRLQSYDATVRWCDLRDGRGHGIEVASWNAVDAQEARSSDELTEGERRAGTDNAIYGNKIAGFDAGPFEFPNAYAGQTAAAQRILCGNEYDGASDIDAGGPCPSSVPAGDGLGHTGGDSPWA